MKRISPIAVFLSLFISTATFLNAQPLTLANKMWQDTTGNPHDTLSLLMGETDGTSNFVIVGNTWPTSDSELVLITKMTLSGSVLWQSRLASISTKRIIATDLDISNGYIYITGTGYDSVNSKSTFATEKISDSTGATIWTEKYTPSYTGYAVAAAVREDNAGNVYISGTEQTGSTNYEMTFLKYNSSGTLQWTSHYDSSGLYSGAVGMGTVASDSLFPVSGYSGSAFGTWDIVSMQVNAYTGAVSSVSRVHNGSGSFISHPVAVAKDTKGDTYIVGASEVSGPNIDIKLIKYDSLFNQTWVRTWGGADSLDDEPACMVIDTNGYLVITGYTSHTSGEIDFLTIRYDKNGNLKWSKTFNNSNSSGTLIAQGTSVTRDGAGNIFATGKVYNGNNYAIATLAYDTGGNTLWQEINADNGSDDIGMNISLDAANDVYVSGTTGTSGSQKYITMLYKQFEPLVCNKSNEFPDTISVPACPAITYTFQNGHMTTTGADTFIEFDIYARTNIKGTPYARGLIYFTYSNATFGDDIVGNNKITVTRGTITADTTYHFTLADTLLKSDIVQPNDGEVQLLITGSNSNSLYGLSDTLKQFCHLKMKTTAFGESKIFFDKFYMQNQSLFYNGSNEPYIYVYTDELMELQESEDDSCSNIIYYIDPASVIVSYNPNQISFDIQAEQSNSGGTLNYGSGSVYVMYNSAAFGTYIADSIIFSSDFFSYADYYISATDAAPDDLQFYIQPTNDTYSATLTDDSLVNILHVIFRFKATTCNNQNAGIVIDSVNTDMPYTTLYALPVNDSFGLFPYCSISAGDNSLDTNLCPPPIVNPTVSSSSPGGCIGAGSFDLVTITGDHFLNGLTGTPTVSFSDANNGENSGYTAETYPQDILSVTENEIVLLVPSRAISSQGPGIGATAGSGDFYVKNPGGLQSSAQNITIIYANQNDRGDTVHPNYNHAQLDYLTRLYTNETFFELDAALFNNSNAYNSVQQCIDDIICNLGVVYELDPVHSVPDPATPGTGTGLIYLNSTDSFWIRNPTVLMKTLVHTNYGCTISSDSQSLSNPTGPYMNDVSSATSIEVRDDGTLSTNIMPGSIKWWFDGTTTPSSYYTYFDFESTLLHEFGHATLLYHSDNGADSTTRVMYYKTRPNFFRRSFSGDPNDIEAVYHNSHLALSVGSVCSASPPDGLDWSFSCPDPGSTCGSVIASVNTVNNPAGESLQAFIYGNPSKGDAVIHIDIYTFTKLTISLYDVIGNRILQKDIEGGQPFDLTLPDAELAAGVYLVNIRTADKQAKAITLKLVKVN